MDRDVSYTPQSRILTTGSATAAQIQAWFVARGKQMAAGFAPGGKYQAPPADLGQIIIEEARRWPAHVVNHDLLAAQISHECAAWQSKYARERNNPSGLGAVNNNPDNAIHFPSPRDGVRATVAHLLTYCAGPGPWTEHDPRAAATPADWQGSVKVLEDLEGKWAFPGDGYADALAKLANILLTTEAPMAGDDPRFQWTPDEHEFGYPDRSHGRSGKPILYLIIHTTEGTDSQAWLREQHGSSTQYLTDRQFKPRAQHVREADAAWTAGHREYNERGINIELEHKAGQAITPEMYRNAAETVKDILDRNGIPPVYLGRDPMKNKPGQKGIIGHGDVPAPNDHTDPTAPWSWDAFMAALKALYQTPENPPSEPGSDERKFETGYTIRGRIRDFWERAEAASVAYQGIGLPVSAEYDAEHSGKKVVRQDFERVLLQYDPAAQFPWDVTALFRSDIPNPAKAELAALEAKLAQIREIVAA